MARLPTPGGDKGSWGDILNEFLNVAHSDDGNIKDIGVVAQKYVKPSGGIPKNDIADGAIDNSKIADNASIDQSKIDGLTADLAAKVNQAELASHASETDNVHGITNTSDLITASHHPAIVYAGKEGILPGSSDSAAALNALATTLSDAGGGIIQLDRGSYTFEESYIGADNVELRGAGIYATTIFIADDRPSGTPAIKLNGIDHWKLSNFTVDANWPNQPQGSIHGIQIDDCSHGFLENVRVYNYKGYGIAVAQEACCQYLNFKYIYIEHGARDGLDMKNRPNGRFTGNLGMIFDHFYVTDWGHGDNGEAGLDIRGPATVSNFWAWDPASTDVEAEGLRFRSGNGDSNGEGAHYSSLTNFKITNCPVGVGSYARNVTISNGTAESCDVGFKSSQVAEATKFVGVHARNGGTGMVDLGKNTEWIACSARGNSLNGLEFQAVAKRCRVVGGDFTNNGGYGIDIWPGATDIHIIDPDLADEASAANQSYQWGSNTLGAYRDQGNSTTLLDSGETRRKIADSGSAFTFSLRPSRNFDITMTDDCTFSWPGQTEMNPSEQYRLKVTLRTGEGGYTPTWPSNTAWAGGSEPTATTTAGRADMYEFESLWDGNEVIWVGHDRGRDIDLSDAAVPAAPPAGSYETPAVVQTISVGTSNNSFVTFAVLSNNPTPGNKLIAIVGMTEDEPPLEIEGFTTVLQRHHAMEPKVSLSIHVRDVEEGDSNTWGVGIPSQQATSGMSMALFEVSGLKAGPGVLASIQDETANATTSFKLGPTPLLLQTHGFAVLGVFGTGSLAPNTDNPHSYSNDFTAIPHSNRLAGAYKVITDGSSPQCTTTWNLSRQAVAGMVVFPAAEA